MAPNVLNRTFAASSANRKWVADFTDLWTAIWAESLRVKGGTYIPDATDVKAADQFYKWIRQQLAAELKLTTALAHGTGRTPWVQIDRCP